MSEYFLKIGAEDPQGPLLREDIAELANCGRIRPTDLVSEDGDTWRPASSLPGVYFAAGHVRERSEASPIGKCRDCGDRVSRRARACPHCGAPTHSSHQPTSKLQYGLAAIASMGAATACGYAAISGSVGVFFVAAVLSIVAIGVSIVARLE